MQRVQKPIMSNTITRLKPLRPENVIIDWACRNINWTLWIRVQLQTRFEFGYSSTGRPPSLSLHVHNTEDREGQTGGHVVTSSVFLHLRPRARPLRNMAAT